MSSFAYWREYLLRARNGHSRPVKNNTRVHWHWNSKDAISIEYHSTDVVTFHAGGRVTLATAGWYTVTTLQRIREFSCARINTNGGDWQIPFAPDPNDPEPRAPLRREIPKPFHATDPGPEPVDDGVGCRVGEVEEYEVQDDRTIYDWGGDDWDSCRGFPVPGSDWNRKRGHRAVRLTGIVREEYIGMGHDGYYRDWEAERDVHARGRGAKVCPHCAAFAKLHGAWSAKMNGDRSSGERGERGYRQMTEGLEFYGSREAWQDAYITELREVRANRQAHKEWLERNMCSFYGGIEIDSSGMVPLKFKRKHEQQLRAKKRAERKRKREAAEVAARMAKREQCRAYEREVKEQIVLALAGNVNTELDALRPHWRAIKEKHHGKQAVS